MLLMAEAESEARGDFNTAVFLLTSLAFVVNMEKSIGSPSQQIEFLGFKVDSRKMTIALPTQKLVSLRCQARHMKAARQTTVSEISQMLGSMVAAHPAILPAPLHYRQLERTKSFYLRQGWSFDDMVPVSPSMKSYLSWWIDKVRSFNGRPLQISCWNLTVESDASRSGWGGQLLRCEYGCSVDRSRTGSTHQLFGTESCLLALQTFYSGKTGVSVLLLLDNITAITFINKMRGNHSYTLSDLTVEIWNWCINRLIIIHAEHLPGVQNIRADWESRHTRDSSDWKLDRKVFLCLEERLGTFSIDLFAYRMNNQLPVYCSWKLDPAAVAIDALSIPWTGHYPYMFPPFALISCCLTKLHKEEVSAVLIAPVCPNQTWFAQLLNSLVDLPILLPPIPQIVTNSAGQNHPLAGEGHLPLATWPVSGEVAKQEDFLTELSTSSENLGEHQQNHPTPVPGNSGIDGALRGIPIPFQLL